MTAYHAPQIAEGRRRCVAPPDPPGEGVVCGQLEEEHDDPDDLMARLAAYHAAQGVGRNAAGQAIRLVDVALRAGRDP